MLLRPRSQRVVVSTVFVGAMFMSILDATIVNVALPAMGRSFGVTAASMSSVSVGFLVSLAVVIPASAWLGHRFGTRRVFLGALMAFVAASVLCGAAANLPELVVFRVVQGVGGGMLAPVGMTMLFHVYSPSERVRASRILTVPTTLAPASGPVLGGLLVDSVGWRWVFYVNVPIGIATVVFGLLFLQDTDERRPQRFDVPGFVLSAIGFAALMYAISEGAAQGWSSPLVLAAGLTGLVCLVALVPVETRVAAPLLNLRLFHDRLFRAVNLVSVLGAAAFMGVLFVFPLMLQEAFGRSAIAAGLTVFPEAIGVMAATQVLSRVYPRVGPRRLMAGGMVGVAAMALLLSRVDAGTNAWLVRLVLLLLGASMANIFMSSQAAAFATVPRHQTGQGSSLFNALRQLGQALGTGVMGTVLAAVGVLRHTSGAAVANLAAYHSGFLAAAGFALLGAVAALLVRDRDAASTMRRVTSLAEPARPDLVGQ